MLSFYGDGRLRYSPLPSDKIDAVSLAANVAKRYTIPAETKVIVFSATGDFWVKFGNAAVNAVIPVADVVDGSAPEFCPASRNVPPAATSISFIAPAACLVTIACYSY